MSLRKYLLLFAPAVMAAIYLLPNYQVAYAESFNPGNIIDDYVFTNKNAMDTGQIQSFLNSKVPSCDTNGTQSAADFGRPDLTHTQYAASRGWQSPPYTCLRNYSQNGKSAAQIIYETSQQYSINPQVFLVLLQKEQGLVTDTWPLNSQYRSATGYGCPDTAACDSQYYGFTNQVQWAGKMFRSILDQSPTWYSPYTLGSNYILWNPNHSCGGSTVNIENLSTVALYDYTPYRPNVAALNAGYGTGDSCSSYGNRNFFLYFRDWFGSTHAQYTKLDTPRWMQVSRDTSKKSIGTGQAMDPIEQGSQLYLVDKLYTNGNWYLRSEYDRAHGLAKGVLQSDTQEVPYASFEEPRYLKLASRSYKLNARTRAYNTSQAFPVGLSTRFTSKIAVGGQLFFRTEYDTALGADRVFSAGSLTNLTYDNFEVPRYLRIKNNAHKVNPATGEQTDAVSAGTQILFTSKVVAGSTLYFRTQADTTSETNAAISAADVEEIPYEALDSSTIFRVKSDTQKVIPASGTQIPGTLTANTVLKMTEKIVVNGVTYYRTEYDQHHNLNKALPASVLELQD